MAQEKVRAPFAGTLVELRVTDGDRVRRGEAIGSVVARDSEAALAGAREMERDAKTDAERRDAARAVELARRNLVRSPLSAAADGIVVSHAASAGDRVSEDEEILSIAETGSLVVLADVPQAQLPKVRPGERAQIEIPGRAPVGGTVHGILAESGPSDLTAPVRVDLDAAATGAAVGLFATARITVAERKDVPSVPDAAVVRDDVTGASRVATVGADGKAHWIAVTPGISQNGRTEIAAPALDPATRVIVSGQAGLPEGTPVSLAQ
jgi:Cu(I)/Ag(I) efflux system membrane fusion protein